MRVLNDSYLMNTNKTGFRWFSKNFASLVLWTKVALALEGLRHFNTAAINGLDI